MLNCIVTQTFSVYLVFNNLNVVENITTYVAFKIYSIAQLKLGMAHFTNPP